MGWPPTSTCTRETPAACGHARRRSPAVRAASSASSKAVKDGIKPSPDVPRGTSAPPARSTRSVPRGTSSWAADLDDRAAAVEIDLPVGPVGEGVRGGQREHPAARPDEPPGELEPLIWRERRARDRGIEHARALARDRFTTRELDRHTRAEPELAHRGAKEGHFLGDRLTQLDGQMRTQD